MEELLPLDGELAVLLARGEDGQVVTWPLVETVQRAGILVELRAPAAVDAGTARAAEALGRRVAEEIGVVGVVAVELFRSRGELLVNEVALRPHNSGHWTIEGARTDQFENHLRAALGWPLGPTELRDGAAVTVNVLGPADGSDPRDRLPDALTVPGVAVHWYGKPARPGRKLGHVTATAEDHPSAHGAAWRAAELLGGPTDG